MYCIKKAVFEEIDVILMINECSKRQCEYPLGISDKLLSLKCGLVYFCL